MSLCKYKNALGIPGKGIHSYRIFDIAVVDVVMTIIGAYVLSLIFRFSFLYITIALFAAGVALHRLFCVRTTVDKFLFS
jgi:uncharacterized membrane protein